MKHLTILLTLIQYDPNAYDCSDPLAQFDVYRKCNSTSDYILRDQQRQFDILRQDVDELELIRPNPYYPPNYPYLHYPQRRPK